MDVASIEAIASAVSSIVQAIVAIAPAVEQGVASTVPYEQALVGLINGSNVTVAQLDATLASVNAASAQFQQPLPLDDGTTTT